MDQNGQGDALSISATSAVIVEGFVEGFVE